MKVHEAMSRDRVAISSDDDELTIICSGRLWLMYHAVGSEVIEQVLGEESETGMADAIRRHADEIAAAVMAAKSIR